MGIITNLLTSLGILRKRCNILLVGLDNSGKTTMVNNLKVDKIPNTDIIPTIGFNLETFSKSRIQFSVFDMSGQGRYRDLWQHYFGECDAIVFVVDSSDKVRICVARDELESMLAHDVIKSSPTPILFFANKSDLPNGMTPAEVSHALGLEIIKDRNWYICGCNSLTGQGLNEGFDWLAEQLSKQ